MIMPDNKEKLINLIADLDEDAVLDFIHQLMTEGLNPLEIIDYCHKGMVEVGKRYETGSYFISGLIMAGEIMRQVSQILFPYIGSENTDNNYGSIVLGTVEGDIHFIGKDIFKTLVRVNGFTVHDLGVDVPPGKFLAAVLEFKPIIIGFSCLITSAYKPMGEIIDFLRKRIPEDFAPLAYIIGGQVDELVCKQVNADYWVNNAMEGVRVCQNIMKQNVK
ncbi:MAG: cobalamin-dependent protein [Spirochaetes bacterium]|nr:cobalamin-dependent protein [Spirochaetota bacterium]